MEEIEDIPARFCITFKGKKYKIFSYFNAASDGSFAVHTYLSWAYTGKCDFGKDYAKQVINLKSVKKSNFKVFKTNFHKSGSITLKDVNDQRFSTDISGMNFEEIKDLIMLFFIRPVLVEYYPEAKESKKYYELTIESYEVLPPVIQGYLCLKDFDFEKCFIAKHPEGHYFVDRNILSRFNLDLYTYVRRAKDGIYPNAQAIGIYRYK
jgi:hypothetical protein